MLALNSLESVLSVMWLYNEMEDITNITFMAAQIKKPAFALDEVLHNCKQPAIMAYVSTFQCTLVYCELCIVEVIADILNCRYVEQL